jgi:hypothetical protein
MEGITLWLSIITALFVIQGGLSLYFVNWVLWRWNTLLTKINIESQQLNNTSEEE